MKTVSYQLSSMKCLDDGWTLRPPSPLLSNLGNNVFEMKPLDTSLFTDGKVNKSGKHISLNLPGNQKIGNQQSECAYLHSILLVVVWPMLFSLIFADV